jgi:predicted metal-binding membrane protein
MAMPGGWTMSMAWMRMPGQTWGDATTLFVGMWVVMMVAMMLPSLGPVLWRWRLAMVKSGVGSPDSMAAAIGTGYFVVWTGVGMLLFPLGACVAAIAMRSTALARDVPFASGLVVLMAGALQFTGWKAHHLACCRNAPGNAFGVPEDARTAWRQGLRLGMHCGLTCANLTAVLVALGVMNLGAMAIVTAAITVERVVPRAERVAQAIGIAIVTGGLILIARATGLV